MFYKRTRLIKDRIVKYVLSFVKLTILLILINFKARLFRRTIEFLLQLSYNC